MKTIVIGHRGVGKSTLMDRLKFSLDERQTLCYDLDDEIEKRIGKKISDFFVEHGESYFREVEKQVFIEFIQKTNDSCFIFAGAGFDVSIIPQNVEVLWVRRKTDADGRIFLNRPRLERDLSPLQEYQKRFKEREKKYQQIATRIYEMPEGQLQNKQIAQKIEKQIIFSEFNEIGGMITVLPEHLKNQFTWDQFLNRYKNKKIDGFELRQDLIPFDRFDSIFQDLKSEKIMLSIRNLNPISTFEKYFSQCEWVDWSVELGHIDEISLHENIKNLILSQHSQMLVELEEAYLESIKYRQNVYLKWSPFFEQFDNLMIGLQWQKQNPLIHSYLPRSNNGRWSWIRLLLKQKQLINFWREGSGSALDQPTIFDWLTSPGNCPQFAAVLGEPIHHSYSPVEHLDLFQKYQMPFFTIQLNTNEWDNAIGDLQKLGLKCAAVTSPLKEKAAHLIADRHFKSVNTLFNIDQIRWSGCSTDVIGFRELVEGIDILAPLQSQIVVWGGGGVLSIIQEVFPQAKYFSARTGYQRGEERISGFQSENPEILIWAAPRTDLTMFPPLDWKPKLIIDLNYKEDSMGKEYAFLSGCNYLSGEKMFIVQAMAQRKFWSKEIGL